MSQNSAPNSTMMSAAVLEAFGSELVLRDIPRPVPSRGEVLVRVEASGVNPLDTKIRGGSAAHAQVSPPAILGLDLAGVVAAVGPDVTRFAAGDQVYGMTGGVGSLPGSLAEYSAVDGDLLAVKPAGLTMAEAAALPLAVIIAWEGLVDRANVRDGQRVLVHGGAGGVGHVAVQIALARGATVYATGTGDSLDIIRRLGAEPIDRKVPILTGKGRAHHGEILAQAAALVASGQLRPILDPGVYGMESIAEAHRAVESGTARGKVVVNIRA